MRIRGNYLRLPFPQETEHCAALHCMQYWLCADLYRHAKGKQRLDMLRLLIFQIPLDMGENRNKPGSARKLIELIYKLIRPGAGWETD